MKIRELYSSSPKIFFALILLVVFSFGGFVGFIFGTNQNSVVPTPIRRTDPNYKLIKPLVGIDVPKQDFPEFSSLKTNLSNFIEALNKKNIEASVYYRNLESGHWLGINEEETYRPASLLKVPIMISYLKSALSHPDLFSKRLYYSGPLTKNREVEYTKEQSVMIPGHWYNIADLLDYMITNSDNNAKDLLLANIDQGSFDAVLTEVGVKPIDAPNYQISVKSYSLFFRILYNATLLNREMSEKGLELLAKVNFDQGLAGGVPESVEIAHKYGERVSYSGGRQVGVEFHDCGIIYHPENPYLLCVMTRGQDVSALEQAIQQISSLAYSDSTAHTK